MLFAFNERFFVSEIDFRFQGTIFAFKNRQIAFRNRFPVSTNDSWSQRMISDFRERFFVSKTVFRFQEWFSSPHSPTEGSSSWTHGVQTFDYFVSGMTPATKPFIFARTFPRN
jgi:hypothetical protein